MTWTVRVLACLWLVALTSASLRAEQPDGAPVIIFAAVSGNGVGLVTSSPAGISCPGACSQGFTAGTLLRLTATPQAGNFAFTRWTGGPCVNSSNPVCEFTVTVATTAGAEFMTTYSLSILIDGTGSGRITSVPAGVDCTVNCFASFVSGTTVTLTATPNVGSVFAGWSPPPFPPTDCVGSQTQCTLTMSGGRIARARFNVAPPPMFRLDVFLAGNAQGTVTGSPGGINCPGVCSGDYAVGTTVDLQAAAMSGSTFTHWSGSCSGTVPTCAVTMDMARSAHAHFQTAPRVLNVFLTGGGSGRIASVPTGIDCPGTCSASFPSGTQVTLIAQTNPGSQFTGWQGNPCAASGTGDCTLLMLQQFTVIGNFEIDTDTIFVSGFD